MATGKIIGMLTLAAALLLAAGTLPAAEQPGVEGGKDRCLLDVNACPGRSDDILQIIEKLKREIGKGERVYTREELRVLERKLVEYEDLLFWLLHDQGGV